MSDERNRRAIDLHGDYEAVIFDLDGTLVELAVNWDVVRTDAAAALRDHGVSPPASLWGILEAADESGNREPVEHIISRHEKEGAHESRKLPTADTVPDGPVGVCSLNCEAACRIALTTHDIRDVDVIVGRDTVPTEKPDPEPLLTAVEHLDVAPSAAVFVGDTNRDKSTAQQAGIDYVDVSEWLRAYK